MKRQYGATIVYRSAGRGPQNPLVRAVAAAAAGADALPRVMTGFHPTAAGRDAAVRSRSRSLAAGGAAVEDVRRYDRCARCDGAGRVFTRPGGHTTRTCPACDGTG